MRGGRKSDKLRERDRSGKREIRVDGGQRRPDRVGLGVEWSGVGWWSVAAKLATLSKKEKKS